MRAELFVLGGRDAGQSLAFSAPVVVGRGADCDLRLRDRSISRRHARLEPSGDGWVLVDLDSRNGVRHGGERVRRCVLADFAEFTLGDVPLRLRVAQAGAAGAVGAPPHDRALEQAGTAVVPRPDLPLPWKKIASPGVSSGLMPSAVRLELTSKRRVT